MKISLKFTFSSCRFHLSSFRIQSSRLRMDGFASTKVTFQSLISIQKFLEPVLFEIKLWQKNRVKPVLQMHINDKNVVQNNHVIWKPTLLYERLNKNFKKLMMTIMSLITSVMTVTTEIIKDFLLISKKSTLPNPSVINTTSIDDPLVKVPTFHGR